MRRDTAEEIVSGVFADLWQRRASVSVSVSVKAYLFGAVRNQSINRLRARLREDTIPLENPHVRDLEDPICVRSETRKAEFWSEFDQVLAAMPKQRRMVFQLSRFEGLRYREIAAVLGLSERTVQNHMTLAVGQLAPALPRLRELLQI